MAFRRRNPNDPGSSRHGRDDRKARAAGDAQERIILDALEDLRDTTVREVMTPRVDVCALTIPVTADSVSRAVRESGHSCFPVVADNLDDLVGVLFVNDLFRAGFKVGSRPGPAGVEGTDAGAEGTRGPDPVDISRRLRQPLLIPESRHVLDALADMRRQRRAFAVVVDEFGGVEGVLTVKDLLGALVGDLPDEFDQDEEPEVVRVDGTRWLVDGRMSVDDIRERLAIAVPEGEYVTVGGFLFEGFGHIPTEGEALSVDGWELRVAEMDRRRIAKIVARHVAASDDDRPTPEAGGSSGGQGRAAPRTTAGTGDDNGQERSPSRGASNRNGGGTAPPVG